MLESHKCACLLLTFYFHWLFPLSSRESSPGNRSIYKPTRERYTKIWFINGVDNVNWPPYRDWKRNWHQRLVWEMEASSDGLLFLVNSKMSRYRDDAESRISMPLERDTPKGVENLKLQIHIFPLEKTSKQTSKQKNKTQTKKVSKPSLMGQHEIMDYFICSANVHVQMLSILCQYAPARTVWIKTRLQ